MASLLRDFDILNPPTFYGSNVKEQHQVFIHEINKIFYDMGFTTSVKTELDTYQLKDVAQTWYF